MFIQTKLHIKHGEHIMFTEAPKKPNVVCFKSMT